MKPLVRSTAIAVATLLALSACKGENKPVEVSSSKTEADKAATDKTGYPGLPTEKEQVSYMIGMAMGKQLAEIKDEVNVDTVVKALRTQMDGGKALINDEQAQQIMQAFGQKMQAKQIAKMMEEGKANLDKGEKFLAENGKKPGVRHHRFRPAVPGPHRGQGRQARAPPTACKRELQGHPAGRQEVRQLLQARRAGGAAAAGRDPGLGRRPAADAGGRQVQVLDPGQAGLRRAGAADPIGPNQVLVFEVELLEIVKAPSGK